ncbi:ROK family protein [Nocardia tengchongensis]|uniref:ROK family protein n=1 Tax=Nocardia tengchongensis TaxID=2055889 RepID=UPI0036893F2E
MTELALEIGAGGIAAVRVADDVEDDDIRRIEVPPQQVWQSCEQLLREVADGGEVTSLAIACAGPIDMGAGIVAPAGVPQWRAGFDIVAAAQAAFPGAIVQLALDGVALVLAERTLGAMQGVPDALAVSLSERIVGGLAVGGFAVVGRTGNAGNIGHMLVPGCDEPCLCGGRGCLDAVGGGLALCRWARAQGWRGGSVAELAHAAAAGDQVAVAAAGRAGVALGRGIVSAAALLDIDLVVVGGELATAGRALWNPLGETVAEHARLSYLPGLRVVPSPLRGIAVLAGAGVMAHAAVA